MPWFTAMVFWEKVFSFLEGVFMPELKTQTQKMQSSKPNTLMVFLIANLYWNAGQTKIIAAVLL